MKTVLDEAGSTAAHLTSDRQLRQRATVLLMEFYERGRTDEREENKNLLKRAQDAEMKCKGMEEALKKTNSVMTEILEFYRSTDAHLAVMTDEQKSYCGQLWAAFEVRQFKNEEVLDAIDLARTALEK